ncbi:MAG: sigma-70 family RNA polymerase sigma factor [Prevotellaceae bacterium]|nr:sigma-70 family RNA polymerase sigma factor [Candidatus Minthosoma caballi]
MTDEELVVMYIDGNNCAFDILLKRYENKVFSYLLYAVKNQELAEDLFQDVFIKIVMRIKEGHYAEHGKFSSWLMRIVHNHVIDYFRTAPSSIVISNDETEYDLLNDKSIAVNDNREQEMIDQQTMREVKALIEMLPENQREVLMMRYFDELSFKEIAVKTNCSINTALGRMRYALINLRHLAYETGMAS